MMWLALRRSQVLAPHTTLVLQLGPHTTLVLQLGLQLGL